MLTLIEDASILLGEELRFIDRGFIEIQDGIIRDTGEGELPWDHNADIVLDGSGLLAIPGFVDAHIHLGDSVAKDIGIGSNLYDLVHPIHGIKTKLLSEIHEEEICRAMDTTLNDMIASGITTYADFREGGIAGVELELRALKEKRMRAVILGRPNYHFDSNEVANDSPLATETMSELSRTIDLCEGIGVSSPNEFTTTAMEQISNLARTKRKLLATHAAESAEGRRFSLEKFSLSEAQRALRYLKPDFVVHFTNTTQEDIRALSEARVPVVCCPRANSILGLGFPPVADLIEANVTVALGTDNVMLNAPDMFREMDYTSRMIRSIRHDPSAVDSRQVLKMATLNGASVLGLKSKTGSLEEDKQADITFLDLNSPNLRYSRNIVGSIVHRAGREDVKCVIVDGDIVYGSIKPGEELP